ncbi:unnamed protein product, partial [Oikopleura dioica]
IVEKKTKLSVCCEIEISNLK